MSKGNKRNLNLLSICRRKNHAVIPTKTAAAAILGKSARKKVSAKMARIVQVSSFFILCRLTKTLILFKLSPTKIYLKYSASAITKYVNPAAIKGPTAIPLKKNTPIIVPTIKAGITLGLLCIKGTPTPPEIAAKSPAVTATIPIGVLNESIMV